MFSYRPRPQNRGFTFTEMTIVLGIIGLVIGATWAAAAKVESNNKAKKTTEQVAVIFQNYKQFFKNGPSRPGTLGGGAQDITQIGIESGAFPPEMVFGNAVRHLWGGPVMVVDNSNDRFRSLMIRYNNLSYKACNLVANAIIDPQTQVMVQAGPAADPGQWPGNPTSPTPIGSSLPTGFESKSWAEWIRMKCANDDTNYVSVYIPFF
jgi:prepilin-type N-terminal cleavage/methylation domain-containing protein